MKYELLPSPELIPAATPARVLRVYLEQSKNYLEAACRTRGVQCKVTNYKNFWEFELRGDPRQIAEAERDFDTRPR